MKFNIAWDSIEKENRNLKILVLLLVGLTISLCVVVIGTASQAPLIIERGCQSRVLSPENASQSDEEMKSFLREAIGARFNTTSNQIEFLSIEQRGFRAAEQEELAKQKMKQFVLVGDITIEKNGLSVDADRLLSVGEVRSTFRFPLKVKLERINRTEANPYGLLLVNIDEIKSEVKK